MSSNCAICLCQKCQTNTASPLVQASARLWLPLLDMGSTTVGGKKKASWCSEVFAYGRLQRHNAQLPPRGLPAPQCDECPGSQGGDPPKHTGKGAGLTGPEGADRNRGQSPLAGMKVENENKRLKRWQKETPTDPGCMLAFFRQEEPDSYQ